MEIRYAFQIAGTRRALPIVDGEAARAPIALSKAKADGFTVLAWPEDPAGPVAAVDLPDHLPAQRDAAIAARAARLEAIAKSPEATNVGADVLETLADRDMPLADARGLLRGLSRRAISNQFRVELETEPMTEAPATPDDPRAARLRVQRDRMVEIKIDGIRHRVESGHARPGDHAKLKEIARAEVLARANRLSLVHALAAAEVTL